MDTVDKALETFDVLDVFTGQGYPEDSVVVYTDTASGYALTKANKAQSTATDPAEVAQYEAAIAEATRKLQETALTFHLRGYSVEHSRDILAETKGLHKISGDEPLTDDAYNTLTHRMLSSSIYRVVNAQGAIQDKMWSPEDVANLQKRLHPTEFNKLVELATELSLSSNFFEYAANPDFS